MLDKQPSANVTDHDVAMAGAIACFIETCICLNSELHFKDKPVLKVKNNIARAN